MNVFITLVFAATMLYANGYNLVQDLEEFDEWPRTLGKPAPAPPPDKCIRDLLIILDMSYSVDYKPFEEHVRPFLESIVKDPTLNVGPQGTHLAMILFSSTSKTKVYFNFGDRNNLTALQKTIDGMNWWTLSGGRTRTGLALELANKDVFPTSNPSNARPTIPDVAILITDGQPTSEIWGEKGRAEKYAQDLKDKNIRLVTLAVGRQRWKFLPFLKKLASSANDSFDAEKHKLDDILKNIIHASCRPFKRGDCDCPTVVSSDLYLTPGQKTMPVQWVEPGLKCERNRKPNFRSTEVIPPKKPGDSFGVGQHVITYIYTFKAGFNLSCLVKFTIMSCQCPSVPQFVVYSDSSSKVKVNWVIPKSKCPVNHTSVSPNVSPGDLFAVGKHTVRYQHAVSGGPKVTCAIGFEVKACQCPNVPNFVVYTHSSTAKVNWNIPKPACPVTQTSVSPNVSPGDLFSVGKHTVRYQHVISGGLKVSCVVSFEVKACRCQNVSHIVAYTDSPTAKAKVNWIIPKPKCPVIRTSSSPNVSPGGLFSVGTHNVRYQHVISGGLTVTCDLGFKVKACQCPSVPHFVAYTDSSSSKAKVNWNIPRPLCPVTQTSVSPSVSPGGLFSVGKHTVSYQHVISGGLKVTCPVGFEVKACTCPPKTKKFHYVTPDNPTRSVSWTVPKPNCPGQQTTVTPNVTPGHTFRIGLHTVTYECKTNAGFMLKCDVDIEIKVIPCQGQDYNPDQKVCCCGELVSAKRGWKCCGRKYYDSSVQKCCPLFSNLVSIHETCPAV